MKHLFLIIILFLTCFSNVLAQETLPPYHWSTQYIDYLKVQGYLPELSISERPFQRSDVAQALLQIDWDELRGKERNIVRLLYREFTPEMHRLDVSGDKNWQELIRRAVDALQMQVLPQSVQPRFKIGLFAEPFWDYSSESDSELSFHGHTQAGFFWKDYLTLYHNFRGFNNADENYIGKEYGGLYGYTEQGYMSLNLGWMRAKFGRDYKQSGPGRSGQLLLSDNSRPFDLYDVRIGNSTINLSFWGISLNPRSVVDSLSADVGRLANRMINGHRLGVSFGEKYSFGVNEMVLYGGAGRQWNFGFMNPFNFYYLHNLNQVHTGERGNLIYSIDWDLYPVDGLEIYGEFLIDDFQVDSEKPSDLEPNELGFMLGVNWTGPRSLSGLLVNGEYVQIRNRTYNVNSNDWEKLLHRSEVIGYYLGNNFNRYSLDVHYYVRPELRVTLSTVLSDQGEGTVQGPFNEDFLLANVDEGYSEAFPFGVVESHTQFGGAVFWRLHKYANISAEVNFHDFSAYQHIEDNSFSETTARVGLWLEWRMLKDIGN